MSEAPTSFLLFDPISKSWSTQEYTLEDLDFMPEVTEESYLCTPDGKTRMTVAEARDYKAKPTQELYHYEVIEHTQTKFEGLLNGSVYDKDGLKKKLNDCARRGYRLVGMCAPNTKEGMNVHGVIAIMEKKIH